MDSSPLPPLDPLIGARLDGRYLVTGALGKGGMGVVYEGLHEQLGRKVAIKVLSAAIATEPVVVQRFLREARIAAGLGHGNIVDVSDLGHLPDGRPYLVMPKIEGTSFADLITARGALPPLRVVELLRGVASALDLVHAKGLVHRDVKPENLMHVVREDGSETVMLMDFGIAVLVSKDMARLTGEGVVCGTPAYLAPESARGEDADHRADVYALATVAFELMTGALPFDADNPLKLLPQKAFRDPPRLGDVAKRPFPEELEAVIARGLAREPDQRYVTAGSFVQALELAINPSAALRAAPTAELGASFPSAPRGPAESAELLVGSSAEFEFDLRADNEGPTAVGAATATAGQTAFSSASLAGPPRRRGGLIALLSAGVLGLAAALTALWPAPAPPPPVSTTSPPSPEPVAAPLAETTPQPASDVPRPEEPAVEPEQSAAASVPPPSESAEPKPAKRPGSAPARAPAPARPAPAPAPTSAQPAPASAPAQGPAAPSSEELAKQANAAFMQGHLPRAAELFTQATARDPRNVAAWRGLGLITERLGRRDEALRAYRRALQLAPSGAQAEAVRARLKVLEGGAP
jgi:eukaryotic-like serine/threonine-protein kinase